MLKCDIRYQSRPGNCKESTIPDLRGTKGPESILIIRASSVASAAIVTKLQIGQRAAKLPAKIVVYGQIRLPNQFSEYTVTHR
jgi:hypothetical protein